MRDHYIILLKEDNPGEVQLADLGKHPLAHLPTLAQAAVNEGYHLMFEFKGKPAMADIQARMANGKGIASMRKMVRLWDLTGGEH